MNKYRQILGEIDLTKPVSLYDYEMWLTKFDLYCYSCRKPVNEFGEAKYYDHVNGLHFIEFQLPQWFYFECNNCKYQTSFVKLNMQIVRKTKDL